MKAQVRWKKLYNLYHFFNTEILHDPIRKILKEYRREAALERKLEAAQRKIEQLQDRVWQFEAQEHNRDDGNEWEKEYYLRGMHR